MALNLNQNNYPQNPPVRAAHICQECKLPFCCERKLPPPADEHCYCLQEIGQDYEDGPIKLLFWCSFDCQDMDLYENSDATQPGEDDDDDFILDNS